MKKLLGIEVSDEQFDYLFCQQSQGKVLKFIDGKVVAVEHEITQEELNKQRKLEIQARLNELSQDFIQASIGAIIVDLEDRKTEFKTLHNELRTLLEKEPRQYI